MKELFYEAMDCNVYEMSKMMIIEINITCIASPQTLREGNCSLLDLCCTTTPITLTTKQVILPGRA